MMRKNLFHAFSLASGGLLASLELLVHILPRSLPSYSLGILPVLVFCVQISQFCKNTSHHVHSGLEAHATPLGLHPHYIFKDPTPKVKF